MLAVELTDSITLGELAVGVGTLALAGITVFLGVETRKSARAAQEAVEASEEPFVIATSTPRLEDMTLRSHEAPQLGHPPPIAIHRALDDGGASFVRLRLWNIGQGPAIVTAVQLRGLEGADLLGELYKFYPVAAGGPADIEIRSPGWPATTPCDGVLTIDYFRASGLVYRTTSQALIGDPTLECRTYQRSRLDA